jgi:hypothetical protein
MKIPWSGPSRDEVRAVAVDLILRHGIDASGEAAHLAGIALKLGSLENHRLYSRAAHYIETYLHASSAQSGDGYVSRTRQ